MRGGFVHNRVLIGRLEDALRTAGATTRREHPTGPEPPRGFVDLYASLGPVRIVCEAELRPDRARLAVEKARALEADALLIVVPDPRTVRSVRAAIGRLGALRPRQKTRVFVLTLGQALQWVRTSFPFLTARNAKRPESDNSPKPREARSPARDARPGRDSRIG